VDFIGALGAHRIRVSPGLPVFFGKCVLRNDAIASDPPDDTNTLNVNNNINKRWMNYLVAHPLSIGY
jgi:hypothetical protein